MQLWYEKKHIQTWDMTIVHANDPTTRVLSILYDTKEYNYMLIDEKSTNAEVQNIIRGDDLIIMLGHGNQYGLFSRPDKNGKYDRFLITDRHVQFLRNKICIGIWCHANLFAERYGLHGLFSGMIISEQQEAMDYNIDATAEEIDIEMELFTRRLKACLDEYDLKDIPLIMRNHDYEKSELNVFNYSHLHYFE